jgi:DNA-3-methyladenine glycosylase II
MKHPHYLLLQRDKKMKRLLPKEAFAPLSLEKNICLELCASIMGQQLNVKVAAVIRSRFMALFRTKSPKAQDILAIPFDQLRGIGLSQSKTMYIQNVCQFFIENKLSDKKLHALRDDELIALLIQIKGVGEWTVQMLMMFTMGREDVFAPDDLGVRRAMIKAYGLQHLEGKELRKKMTAIAAHWSPYRSYGCRYLWAWKDQ